MLWWEGTYGAGLPVHCPAPPVYARVAKRCGSEAQMGAASASGSLRSTHVPMSAVDSSSKPSGIVHSTLPCGWVGAVHRVRSAEQLVP